VSRSATALDVYTVVRLEHVPGSDIAYLVLDSETHTARCVVRVEAMQNMPKG
jgi:hypothetical protein